MTFGTPQGENTITKKLRVEIEATMLGVMGVDKLKSAMRDLDLSGKKAAAARLKGLKAEERATASLFTLRQRLERETLVMQQANSDKRIAMEERYKLKTRQTYDMIARKEAEIGTIRARNAALGAGRLATGLGMVGTGLIGAGVVGLGAGLVTGRAAMNWQTFVSQNVANAPFGATAAQTQAISKRYQQQAFRIAARTGARPEDVFQTMRYGQEFDIVRRNNMLNPYLRASLALGLPTGGTANIGPSMQAIAGVATAFPQMAQNPRAIANMLLATTQRSAGGLNVQQLAEGIPRVLAMAGHIGGKTPLPDALAAAAALSQTNVGLPEVATSLINFLKVLQSGTARPGSLTSKTLGALKSQHGINLFPDFSQQGLAQKGLGGVLTDIAGAHLSQKTLYTLFPNMRGTLAALGLTGNQLENFRSVQPAIANAPKANPIAQNMQMYLGLSSTKMAELQQQFHILAITTGTQLLPVFNKLMKDDIIPGAKAVGNFAKENRDLIAGFVEASPKLLAAGVALKLVGGALGFVVKAQEAGGILKAVGVSLGLVSKEAGISTALNADATAMKALGANAAISTELQGTSTAVRDLGLASSAATGGATAGGFLGILGLVAGLKILGDQLNSMDGNMGKNSPFLKSGAPGSFWNRYHLPNPNGPTNNVQYPNSPNYPSNRSLIAAAAQGPAVVPVAPRNWNPGYGIVGMRQLPSGGGLINSPFYENGQPAAQSWIGGPKGSWQNPKGGVAFHWDMGTGSDIPAHHEPVYLPGPKNLWFTLIGQVNSPAGEIQPGWVQTWSAPTSKGLAVFTFDHLSEIRKGLRVGSRLHGGDYAGRSGGTHLHISGNAAARDLFYGASTGHIKVPTAPTSSSSRGGSGPLARYSGANNVSTNYHTAFNREIPYMPKMVSAGKKYHVDPAVLIAIGARESGGQIGTPSAAPKGTMGSISNPNTVNGQITGAARDLRGNINWASKLPASRLHQADPYLRKLGIKHPTKNEEILLWAVYRYTGSTSLELAASYLQTSIQGDNGYFPATYWTGKGPSRPTTTTPSGGTNVNLGDKKTLTPYQKWDTREQGDLNQINRMLGNWGWPANTPMSRIKNEGRREMIAPWYKAATYAFAQKQIAQINQLPISEARKAAMRKEVWKLYYNGSLSKELFPPASASKANGRPTTPSGWASWYGTNITQQQQTTAALLGGKDPLSLHYNRDPHSRYQRTAAAGRKWAKDLYKERKAQLMEIPGMTSHQADMILGGQGAWKQEQWRLHHPMQFLHNQMAAGGSTHAGGIIQWHITQRCKAEAEANVTRRRTTKNTHDTSKHTKRTADTLDTHTPLLQTIAQNTTMLVRRAGIGSPGVSPLPVHAAGA